MFTAQNVKLTAMLTLDFPEYYETCKYARQRFFADEFTVPSPSAVKNFEKTCMAKRRSIPEPSFNLHNLAALQPEGVPAPTLMG